MNFNIKKKNYRNENYVLLMAKSGSLTLKYNNKNDLFLLKTDIVTLLSDKLKSDEFFEFPIKWVVVSFKNGLVENKEEINGVFDHLTFHPKNIKVKNKDIRRTHLHIKGKKNPIKIFHSLNSQ